MGNSNANPFTREALTENLLEEWQGLLNETAEILGVPSGLITRVDAKEIEILLSSETEGQPLPGSIYVTVPGFRVVL